MLRTQLSVLVLVAATLVGCKEEAQKVRPEARGGRGESCLARNDCEKGLACIPGVGGTGRCSKNDFDIDVVPKQCDVIECESQEDCCEDYLPGQCDAYKAMCDAGDTFYCDQYDTSCNCGDAPVDCQDNVCVPVFNCDTDIDCNFNETCTGGKCVECMANADCSGDDLCIEGQCRAGCQRNEECPLFTQCMSGQCVESGCMSDRECIAALEGHPLALEAKCIDEDCVIACENDGECGGQSVCSDGACTFIGCETDEECRYFLGVENNDRLQAVCRE